MQKSQDVVVHAAVAETIRAVCIGLRDTIRKPTEAALFDNYGRMCMVIDEVINEARPNCSLNSTVHVSSVITSVVCLQGILEAADRDAIQRGMKMKVSPFCLETSDSSILYLLFASL